MSLKNRRCCRAPPPSRGAPDHRPHVDCEVKWRTAHPGVHRRRLAGTLPERRGDDLHASRGRRRREPSLPAVRDGSELHGYSPASGGQQQLDVAAIDALLDVGADINAGGAVFTGGGPLSDAVVFANWAAARRLVERGARVDWWQAAALGLLGIMCDRWDEQPPPSRDEITRAFWHACRGGHRSTAEYLLDRGADPHWLGWDHKTPIRAADDSGNTDFIAWLHSRL